MSSQKQLYIVHYVDYNVKLNSYTQDSQKNEKISEWINENLSCMFPPGIIQAGLDVSRFSGRDTVGQVLASAFFFPAQKEREEHFSASPCRN